MSGWRHHELWSPDEPPAGSPNESRQAVIQLLQGDSSPEIAVQPEISTAPEKSVERQDPYPRIKNAIPTSKYGIETVGQTTQDFKDKLAVAFAHREVDEFFQSRAPVPESIYLVLQDQPPEDENASTVYANHQRAALENQIQQLEEVAIQLTQKNFPNMPPAVLKAYQRAVAEKIRHAQAMMELGTPEFTKLHRSPREWGELLGDNLAPGTRLPFAETAEKMLRESNLGVEASKDDVHQTVGEALEIFNISETELATLEITPDMQKLTPEQGMELFRFLLKRLGYHEWKVEPSGGAAINVAAAGRSIAFPKTRELLASELRFITAHEFVHVIRGENGSHQPYKLLQIGLPDYLKTEEGLATLVEMIVGEKTSHERMRKLAARYVAVDMALQVEYDEAGTPLKAANSPQKIYDKLVDDLGVSDKDARDIIWRIFRNTSLTQQLVEIQVEKSNGEVVQHVIPEVFPKDAVYYEGLRHMFEWIKSLFPDDAEYIEVLRHQPDFNDLALFVIEQMLKNGLNSGPQLLAHAAANENPQSEIHRIKFQEGISYLLQLLEQWMLGKIDFTSDGKLEWSGALDPAITRYSRLFEANR